MATISNKLELRLPTPADNVNVTLDLTNNMIKIDKFAEDISKDVSNAKEDIQRIDGEVGTKPATAPNYFEIGDSLYDALVKLDAKIKEISDEYVADVYVENSTLTVEYGDETTEDYPL